MWHNDDCLFRCRCLKGVYSLVHLGAILLSSVFSVF